MEFQANYFASCLLMPRANFIEDFRRLVRARGIPDRGFGALYVDDQPCNLDNYEVVTSALVRKYGVSRTAAALRLDALGLIRDARRSFRPLLAHGLPTWLVSDKGVESEDLSK
jgi:Zn-dependent peptidase ImmA (M78 family)